MSKEMAKSETTYDLMTAEERQTHTAIRLRLVAIYHTALSSAAFKREDALRCDNENEAIALRREAGIYEVAAGWIDAITKEYHERGIAKKSK